MTIARNDKHVHSLAISATKWLEHRKNNTVFLVPTTVQKSFTTSGEKQFINVKDGMKVTLKSGKPYICSCNQKSDICEQNDIPLPPPLLSRLMR